MGQSLTIEGSPEQMNMTTKRRRTEVEKLAEDLVTTNGDKTPSENGVARGTKSRLRHSMEQPKDEKELIRSQNCRIEMLLEENEQLKSRLADLEARLSVFVEPTQGMVPHRRRNGIDDKKTKRGMRTRERIQVPELAVNGPQPLTIDSEYPLYQRIVVMDDDCAPGTVETPKWRIHIILPLKIAKKSQNDEDLSDNIFLKRHQKSEIDERRQKRWDHQWLSDRRRFDRARRKRSANSAQANSSTKTVATFSPSVSRVQEIEVTTCLPVVAWGCNLPVFELNEFSVEEQ